MATISCFCPFCKAYGSVEARGTLSCPHCHKEWGTVAGGVFDKCPCCAGRQFYTDKDFNQVIGWVFLGIAIILVPATYGLSLGGLALADFLLRKYIKNMVVCYKCAAEFRGMPIPANFKPFMHHIGLKYDKYR